MLTAHTDCDGPAVAIEGVSSLRIVTVSRSTGQPDPPIVQINWLFPIPKPVIVVLGDVGEVILPEPDNKLQVPVPAVGVLPAIVAVVAQTVWSLPALAKESTTPHPHLATAILLLVAVAKVVVPNAEGPVV